MKLSKKMIVGLWLLCIIDTTGAYAEEQRCKGLGINCVCSEPFNTNVLPKVSSSWYNPGDSVIKECSTNSSISGGAIERNRTDLFGSNDSTVLSRLPAGNSVSYFVRGPQQHNGIYLAGNRLRSQFVKRTAMRFYIYHSPDFEFKDEGLCENSKLAQSVDAALHLDKSFGYVHLYNFLTWTPSQDCCNTGPGPDENAITKASWRDKWWRVEIVLINRAGGDPGFVAKVYMKNVTDNGPEFTVIDTSYPRTDLVSSNTRTPPRRIDDMFISNYRQGTCKGWVGISHYMLAGWDVDQGQRIGAAYEVEGGSKNFILNSPSNLRVVN